MSSEIPDIDDLPGYAVKLCTSQLYRNRERTKPIWSIGHFVAPPNACGPYLEEMTKFNACATYRASPRAKTMQRL